MTSLAPWKSPPIRMAPPPVAPEASTAVDARLTAFVAVTVTDPPRPPALLAASVRPAQGDVAAADRDRPAFTKARGRKLAADRDVAAGTAA